MNLLLRAGIIIVLLLGAGLNFFYSSIHNNEGYISGAPDWRIWLAERYIMNGDPENADSQVGAIVMAQIEEINKKASMKADEQTKELYMGNFYLQDLHKLQRVNPALYQRYACVYIQRGTRHFTNAKELYRKNGHSQDGNMDHFIEELVAFMPPNQAC